MRRWGVASLLALLAACAAPESEPGKGEAADPEQARILEWIAQLGADDVEIRESATARLIRHGPGAMAGLREAIRRGDPEVKLRAGYVLDRIRWDTFPGGEPQAGFKMALQAGKEQYRKGETIRLDLQIRNVQAVEQKIPRIITMAWDTVRCEGVHPGAQAFLLLKQLSGGRQRKSSHFGSHGSDKPYVSLRPVPPGETLAYAFLFLWSTGGVQDHCDDQGRMEFPENLNPGEYEAYVLYFARSKELLKEAQEDLKSNVIRFKVTE